MLAPRLAFFFCATVCFSRYFSPSVKKNENKKIIQQGENLDSFTRFNHSFTPLDFSYMNHQYYMVRSHHIHHWNDLQYHGKYSEVTSEHDDAPPHEIIDTVKEGGWWFPFYGHAHDKIYIDPNGFVSVNDRKCHFFCNWQNGNDATYKRYIAPLMTDFDPKSHSFSKVFYSINENEMIIQWNNVVLYRTNLNGTSREKDGFTFQVVLNRNGKITFNYRYLPYFPGNRTVNIAERGERTYPVVMGVEDASLVEGVLVPYLPVNLDWEKIFADYSEAPLGISVELSPQQQCTEMLSCYDCVEYSKKIEGKCGWCPDTGVCADLIGRQTDDISAPCINTNKALRTLNQCDILKKKSGMSAGEIAIIVIICTFFFIVLGYLFKRHSKKGLRYKKGITGPDNDKGIVNSI